jgi:hypothetical protein
VVAGLGRGLSHVIAVHEPNLGPPGPWTRAERPLMRVRIPATARQVGQDGRCVHRLSEPSGGAV